MRHILLNPADRERTAYHEAGHALLALLVPGSDPVHRVSIVPRGMALGATYQLPVDDRTSYGEDYLRARITSALGGRAAEQLVYGVVTTGAENDLQQVTEIARRMVLRWGMSEKLGPISFVAPQDEGLPPAFQHQPYSEATSELIDAEVRRIVEECHREAEPPARRAPREARRARARAARGASRSTTRITSALGGRAAEQLVYGVVTTGAENDLQQVTEIARRMVLRWGMSRSSVRSASWCRRTRGCRRPSSNSPTARRHRS